MVRSSARRLHVAGASSSLSAACQRKECAIPDSVSRQIVKNLGEIHGKEQEKSEYSLAEVSLSIMLQMTETTG